MPEEPGGARVLGSPNRAQTGKMGAVAAMPLDPSLADRLEQVGLDPADFGDPQQAWQLLHDRFGPRATLIDRYALEAARRGVRPEDLDGDQRARLTREVLSVQYPGIEFTAASGPTLADAIDVVPYCDQWADTFAVWRRRLSEALGDAAVRIEHVGSTAVPGLDAKPIIDIQVSVLDVEDEDAYVSVIEALGVSLRFREPGHRYFRPAGDRARTVHIHVCNAGSDWEREHPLFRDYLRANPKARDAYARLKQELADRYRDDRIAYNEGKTAFILDMLSDAQAWAKRSGWAIPAPEMPDPPGTDLD
jgi:GrpB-like predicted nucleotidyltransferase (UPF0157 family)